jgi:hypothetical protein
VLVDPAFPAARSGSWISASVLVLGIEPVTSCPEGVPGWELPVPVSCFCETTTLCRVGQLGVLLS